jgi:hypothetical protein
MTHKPVCWFVYVDDTFVTWLHGKATLKEFLNHLSSQWKKEEEEDAIFHSWTLARKKIKTHTVVVSLIGKAIALCYQGSVNMTIPETCITNSPRPMINPP